MHNDMKLMGSVIRKAREGKSMTQAGLAEKIDASIRTIIAIENGKRNPTFDVLYRLVHTLDIPTDLIFRPGDTPNTPEQEQFIREFLNAAEVEQQMAVTLSRDAWRVMRGVKA